uniref:Uncharacterized protein n=1 Tax=Amorphochlora amoebiformis TaxID=1561963 RepID=A0A7S0GWI1_9EUKA
MIYKYYENAIQSNKVKILNDFLLSYSKILKFKFSNGINTIYLNNISKIDKTSFIEYKKIILFQFALKELVMKKLRFFIANTYKRLLYNINKSIYGKIIQIAFGKTYNFVSKLVKSFCPTNYHRSLLYSFNNLFLPKSFIFLNKLSKTTHYGYKIKIHKKT